MINGKKEEFEIFVEKDVFYDESSRRWFFRDELGANIGPYDDEISASTALFRYTLEISRTSNED